MRGLRQLHARAREGLNRDFDVVLLRAFSFRQEIPKLCGFSAIQTCLTFADDLDHADADGSANHRVCGKVKRIRRNAPMSADVVFTRFWPRSRARGSVAYVRFGWASDVVFVWVA